MKFHPLHLATLLALAGHGASVLAQQQVTVTARPVIEAQRTDDYASQNTDVGEAQLRDLNALDLASALRRTPGVQVSRFNPVGSFGGDEGGAVYVRGLGTSRPGSEIKTYVDGVPFYMGAWNHPLLDMLPVQGLQRVRVHKGPQPQAFGNTFAAIDLLPRRASRDGLTADVQLNAGSFGTAVEQAALQWRQGPLDLAVTQGFAESDGHREGADGRLFNGLVQAGWQLSPNWALGLTVLHGDNRVGDPGEEGLPATRQGRFDTRAALRALSLSHTHGAWQGRVQVYDNSGTGFWHDNPQAGAADTLSRFNLSGLRWREQFEPLAGLRVLAGLDVERSRGSVAFNGFTAFDMARQTLTSPYLAVSQQLALGQGWTLQPSAGLRAYRHSELGNATAPHLGLVASRGDSLQLRLNAARGLNFPGLDAVLLSGFISQPDAWKQLDAERMDHLEAGVRWAPMAGASLDVSLFHDRLSDRYIAAFPPTVAAPGLYNLGSYRMNGLETSWSQALGRQLEVFASLTLLRPSLDDLPYAPRRAASLGAVWQQGPWRVSADAQAQSSMLTLSRSRFDGNANTRGVAGFGVVNLRVAHALALLGPRGEVFAAVENLADQAYAYRAGYTMPGRAVQFGLRASL